MGEWVPGRSALLSSSWSTLCAQGSSSAFPYSNAAETYGGQTTIRRFLKDTTPSSLLPTFRSPLCGISVAMGGSGWPGRGWCSGAAGREGPWRTWEWRFKSWCLWALESPGGCLKCCLVLSSEMTLSGMWTKTVNPSQMSQYLSSWPLLLSFLRLT